MRWGMDLTTGKRRTEETCKLIFFVYSVLAPPKNASCFLMYFWCEEYKASHSHAQVLINFFIFLEARHDVFTSLHLSTDCEQDKTPKRLENVCVLSDICVCGHKFQFCFRFVSFFFMCCFCFVFVCLVWTRCVGSIWLKIEIVRQLR